MVFINNESGFAGNISRILDDDSVKALYPDYFNKLSNFESPIYKKWEEENKMTGITQKDFAKKEGVGRISEIRRKDLIQYKTKLDREVQKKFEDFVRQHKEEIYEKQVEAIRKTEEDYRRYHNAKTRFCEKLYVEKMASYLKGYEVVAKADDIETINKVLSLGYKVKFLNDKICCMSCDAYATMEDMKRAFPFDEDEFNSEWLKTSPASIKHIAATVCGVTLEPDDFLEGYDYPKFDRSILGW